MTPTKDSAVAAPPVEWVQRIFDPALAWRPFAGKRTTILTVQSRFAETRLAKTQNPNLSLTLNPNHNPKPKPQA